jgi:hypothetical protein
MKPISRPQHYRIRRMLQMVREGIACGRPANSSDFMAEFGISRRTVASSADSDAQSADGWTKGEKEACCEGFINTT